MNREKALNIARKIVDKSKKAKLLAIKNEGLHELLKVEIFAQIPAHIVSSFRSNPEYFEAISYVTIAGVPESIDKFKRYSVRGFLFLYPARGLNPQIRLKGVARKKIISLIKEIKLIEKEISIVREQLVEELVKMRTDKQVANLLPEALPFLTPKVIQVPKTNIKSLREKIK